LNPLIQVLKLKRFLSKYDGVIHAHLPRAELVARVSLKSQPFFVSRHYGERFWPKMPNVFSNILSRFVLHKCKLVIAISHYVEFYLKSSGELPVNTKIEVVPYALNKYFDSNGSMPLGDEYLTLIENKFVIGTVSRLSPEKDLRTFILAIKEVSKRSDKFIGIIIGGGPLDSELKKFVNLNELNEKVVFLGRTLNVANYMKTFDVFLLTSLFEGFGLVLLEAMSVGLPVIGTKTGSIPEVIGDSGPGILVEIGDYKGIAKEIFNLSLNQELVSILSQKGITRSKDFDAKKIAEKINYFYEKLV
jgi:glycosyltransferase involved in cell wall biosynthesis